MSVRLASSLALTLTCACVINAPPTDQTSGLQSSSGMTASSDEGSTSADGSSTTTAEPTTTVTSGPTTTATDDDGSSDSGALGCDPVPESTDDCCCFSTIDHFGSACVYNECPRVALCDSLRIDCLPEDPDCPIEGLGAGEPIPEPFTIDDPAALDCILTALRDGTEGALSWRVTGADNPGWANALWALDVRTGREAFVSELVGVDLGADQSDITLHALSTAEFYDECLNAAELRDRLACLLDPVAEEVIETCTPGGDVSYAEVGCPPGG